MAQYVTSTEERARSGIGEMAGIRSVSRGITTEYQRYLHKIQFRITC